MRSGIATLLATVLSWMLVLPLFAGSVALQLPACCRKDGTHHCAMGAASSGDGSGALVSRNKCGSFPRYTVAAHTNQLGATSNASFIFAGVVSHPAASSHTEAGFRISYHRSRQKRGPPPSLFS
jgi:hypothetical protein